jgi:GNAT superfamily N-acetyltransferase
MNHRPATSDDAFLLGELNHQLIQDEGHRNPMSVPELGERMRKWIVSDYRAILFEQDSSIAAYALYREETELVYLRQFFVQRALRRSGVGRQCMEILFSEVLPLDKRITVDVLTQNSEGVSFWRSLGFSDYCLTLEIYPNLKTQKPNRVPVTEY